MPAEIIDGKAIAEQMREEIAARAAELKEKHGLTPGLGVVLVGNDPGSRAYVSMKEKACAQAGIHSEEVHFEAAASQEAVIAQVRAYADDPAIHAILVQLPLPDHIDEHAVLLSVPPEKDADGFHPFLVGELWCQGDAPFIPCTPYGVLELLKRSGVTLKGARAVIIGRSNIVGKPVGALLLKEHCTVTFCHSRTVDLPAVAREADILVVAIGRAKMVTAEYVKPGATVIDVGINRTEDGKLVGDVDFESASQVAGKITPVPRGVGPMTITMLLNNTVNAAARAVDA
jgi:methylenetetrahydrofolate dehydrogenase (NADP+) / methenyltetrahydrofolate cyclohydrolase